MLEYCEGHRPRIVNEPRHGCYGKVRDEIVAPTTNNVIQKFLGQSWLQFSPTKETDGIIDKQRTVSRCLGKRKRCVAHQVGGKGRGPAF